MADYDYDVGILGGGAAGLTVAAGAARFGAKALLVEKAPKLGGDCLHCGCVPSKTLIRTAGVWAQGRRAAEFGLPSLELPPVDLGAVMGRVRTVIETIQEHDSPERFCGLGAEVRFGAPRFVHDHAADSERAAELARQDTRRDSRDELEQMGIAPLSSPHREVWQFTEARQDPINRLKSLKIDNPAEVLRFTWRATYTTETGVSCRLAAGIGISATCSQLP